MKLHFIAIGGTGMGAAAGLLKAAGHEVRGSDERLYPPMSEQLASLGIPVAEGFRPENLDWGPDRVVVGNVCTRDHVEVRCAEDRHLALTSFPALLEELFLAGRHQVVVAGTHGKTTTSSLLAHTLTDAGLDPSFLVGGVPQNFGRGFRLGQGRHFVIEGDEYDTAFFDKGSKFFHYCPRTAILTSVEYDHADIFPSLAAVREAFRRFVALLPADGRLLVAASCPEAMAVAREAAKCSVESYAACGRAAPGVTPRWHAAIVDERSGRTWFDVTREGHRFGRFHVGLVGEHNIENVLAVIAAASALDLEPDGLRRALARFLGVRRRQEIRGVAGGVAVVDDYAHHPTAVRETIAALRRRHRGKLVAVFEPRSATSRRSTFQAEFADAFAGADEVVVTKLYAPERIPVQERFDPEKLASDLRGRGTAARVIPEVDGIVAQVVERVKPGDCVAIFSSGGFGGIHERLLFRLGDPIMPARVEDMPRVREILELTGLGPTGVAGVTDDRAGETLVCADESGIVGCIMVERYDHAAVMRSLAVIPERRGRGLGWLLAGSAVDRARQLGAERMYLVTAAANDFFAEKLGFRTIDRATVDVEVAASAYFRAFAHLTTAMVLELR